MMKKEGKKWTRKPNPLFPSLTYAGHRRLLPMTHYLRLFGQSGKCCPSGYYENSQDKVRESYFEEDIIIKTPNPPPKILNYRDVARLNKCCGKQEVLFNNELDQFNGTDIADFKTCLYYQHCDYRPFVEYKRISNDKYIEDGNKAILANKSTAKKRKQDEYLYEHNTLSIKDKGTVKNVNGVKGIWPFASLSYCDICENICYDPFHVFKCIIVYYFQFITGKRTIGDRVKKFCRKTLSHPSLNSKSGAMWEIGEANINTIEKKYLRSVVLSKGN